MNATLRQDVLDLAFEGMDTDEIAAVLGVTADQVLDALEVDAADYDDSMDGDWDSAMASAGYGMDEDYVYGPSIYED
jgi:hypothetical protein